MLKRAGSSPPRHDVEAAHTGAVETHQAMGDPSEHRCWQKNSQLFQCQRYSAQCYSVSRLNSLSAGATPYTSTHSGKKRKNCLQVPRDFPKPKMSERSHMSKTADVPKRFEISLILCLRKRFVFVLQIWTVMCLRDNHIPPLLLYSTCGAAWATATRPSDRGRIKVL